MNEQSEIEKASYEKEIKPFPRWASVFLKSYGGLLIFFTTIVLGYLVATSLYIMSVFTSTPISEIIFGKYLIGALLFFVVELAYWFLFAMGIVKREKWAIPILALVAGTTLLSFIVGIVLGGSVSVGTIFGALLSTVVLFVAFSYRKSFHGSAKRLYVQVPMMVIVVVPLLFSFSTLFIKDDVALPDDDLILPTVPVLTSEENIETLIRKPENITDEQQAQFKQVVDYARLVFTENDGEILDIEEAKKYVKGTKGLTDTFITASKREAYQCPTSVNQFHPNTTLCSLVHYRDLARITGLRAVVEAMEGDLSGAFSSASAIVRIGTHLHKREQLSSIEYLTSLSISSMGIETFEAILNEAPTLTPAFISDTKALLDESIYTGESLAVVLKGEYMMAKAGAEQFGKYGSYFYFPNRQQNLRAEHTRKQIEVAMSECGPDFEQQKRKFDKYLKDVREELAVGYMLEPNSIGKLISSYTLISMTNPKEILCQLNVENRELQEALK